MLSAPIPAHCVLGNERLEVAGTLGHDLNCSLQQKGNSNVSMLWVRKRRTRDGKVESKEGKGWGGPRENRLGIPGYLRFLSKL